VKCDDGAGRAAEVILAAMLSKFIELDEFESFVQPTLRNWNGIAVGRLRPTAVFDKTAHD
jgi:L-asparaginase II